MVVREMRLGLHAAYIHDWCVQVSLHQLQHINFKFEFLSPDPVPFFPMDKASPPAGSVLRRTTLIMNYRQEERKGEI